MLDIFGDYLTRLTRLFHTVHSVGTLDLNSFLSVALIFAEGHKVSRKENLWALFSCTLAFPVWDILVLLASVSLHWTGHHRSPLRTNSLRVGGGHPHKPPPRGRHYRETKMRKSRSSPVQLAQASTSDDEGEEEAALTSLHSLSIQLLDLMHTLHTRAASIFAAWAQEGSGTSEGASGDGEKPIDAATGTLWATCWCPLLQGEQQHGTLGDWFGGCCFFLSVWIYVSIMVWGQFFFFLFGSL